MFDPGKSQRAGAKAGKGLRQRHRRNSLPSLMTVIDSMPLLKEVLSIQGISPGHQLLASQQQGIRPAMGGRRMSALQNNVTGSGGSKNDTKSDPYLLLPSLTELENLECQLRHLTERLERQHLAAVTRDMGTQNAMDGPSFQSVWMNDRRLTDPADDENDKILSFVNGDEQTIKFPPYIPASLRDIFTFYKYTSEESVKLLPISSINHVITFIFNEMLIACFERGPFFDRSITSVLDVAKFCFGCIFSLHAVPAVGESTVFSVMKTIYQMDTLSPQARLFARLCEFDGYPKLPRGAVPFCLECRHILLDHCPTFHFETDQQGAEYVPYDVAETVAQILFTTQEAKLIMERCGDGVGSASQGETVEVSVLLEFYLDSWEKDTQISHRYIREAVQAFVADLDGETPSFDDLDYLLEMVGLDLTTFEVSNVYCQVVMELEGSLDAELLHQFIVENGCLGQPQDYIMRTQVLSPHKLAELRAAQEHGSILLLQASWQLIQKDVAHLIELLGSEAPTPQSNRFQDMLGHLKSGEFQLTATDVWTAYNRLLLPLENRGIGEASGQAESIALPKKLESRRQAVNQQELWRVMGLGKAL